MMPSKSTFSQKIYSQVLFQSTSCYILALYQLCDALIKLCKKAQFYLECKYTCNKSTMFYYAQGSLKNGLIPTLVFTLEQVYLAKAYVSLPQNQKRDLREKGSWCHGIRLKVIARLVRHLHQKNVFNVDS